MEDKYLILAALNCLGWRALALALVCLAPCAQATVANTPAIDSLKAVLAEGGASPQARQATLVALGKRLARSQGAKAALGYLEEALTLAAGFNPTLHYELARCHVMMGDFAQAMARFPLLEGYADSVRARLLARPGPMQNDEMPKASSTYTLIGETHRMVGDYPRALGYATKALACAQATGDRAAMANIYNNLGIVYKHQGQFAKAKNYYLRAANLYRASGNDRFLANSYNNLALLYRSTGLYDSASTYFRWALGKTQSPYSKATIFNNLGGVHYDLAAFDSAWAYHRQGLAIQEKYGIEDQACLSRANMASVSRELGRYGESVALGEAAYRWASEHRHHDLMQKSAIILANTHKALGDYQSALRYHEAHKQYADSVYNTAKARQLAQLQHRVDYMEQASENQSLKAENALQSAKIRTQRAVVGGAAALLALLLYALYVLASRHKARQALARQRLYLEQREKQWLEKEVVFKNKELTNFALHIMEKNALIGEVATAIEQWPGHKAQAADAQSLSKKIRGNETIDKHRQEFEAHVNSVHASFYQRLEARYPALSPHERRLAALLRLQLSSKEISSITGVAAKSVDMSRYRLRKKLGLDKTANLSEFLNKV